MSQFEEYLFSHPSNNGHQSQHTHNLINKYVVIDSDNEYEEQYTFPVFKNNPNITSSHSQAYAHAHGPNKGHIDHPSSRHNPTNTSTYNQDSNSHQFILVNQTPQNKQSKRVKSQQSHNLSRIRNKSQVVSEINLSNLNVGNINMSNVNLNMNKQGMINKYIKDRKSEKTRIDLIRFEINKIQGQCSVLQQLIEKTIKQEAELQVRKYNILRGNKLQKTNNYPLQAQNLKMKESNREGKRNGRYSLRDVDRVNVHKHRETENIPYRQHEQNKKDRQSSGQIGNRIQVEKQMEGEEQGRQVISKNKIKQQKYQIMRQLKQLLTPNRQTQQKQNQRQQYRQERTKQNQDSNTGIGSRNRKSENALVKQECREICTNAFQGSSRSKANSNIGNDAVNKMKQQKQRQMYRYDGKEQRNFADIDCYDISKTIKAINNGHHNTANRKKGTHADDHDYNKIR